MSLLTANQVTAIAMAVLAAFAIITAVFAAAAFFKQREEVRTLQKEAKDQETLIKQQGELLKVQAGQLEVQRQQLDDQRAINEKQAEVAALQAQELRESLDERSGVRGRGPADPGPPLAWADRHPIPARQARRSLSPCRSARSATRSPAPGTKPAPG
jgi:hypothetical protein